MAGIFGLKERAFCSLVGLLLMTGVVCAQESASVGLPSAPRIGVPEDWSTSHVIYTRNGAIEDMMKVRNDPRFINNLLLHGMREQRGQAQKAASNDAVMDDAATSPFSETSQNLPKNFGSKVDWAVSLGTTAGMAFGESPAKYSFNPNAAPSCSDFVVYTVNANATAKKQANLVGLTNLYTDAAGTGFCPGTGPTFLFSYAIGTGLSSLSPVLSLDGTKIAWIENRGTTAYLHVTTWVAGQGTNATTGAVAVGSGSSDIAVSYTNATVTGCTAKADTNGDSDIFVDYASDNAFVSSDNGNLYHISGIFSGSPTPDFCIGVNTGAAANAMSGPVYDYLTNEVYITDSKTLYGYTVGASSFTLASSIVYGAGSPYDTGPGPVLDTFNGYIYLFTGKDKNGNTSMSQIPTSLASEVLVTLGPATTNTNDYLFYGTPDNNYYTNGPTGPGSTFYSCGTDPTTTTAQDLYAIGFLSSGLANTTPVMGANTNANPGGKNGLCSPITEFFDGTTDRIFLGNGNATATTGANVVQMWTVTTPLTSTADKPTASASPYNGGTTGFMVDNNASGTAQAESVYFSTLAAGSTGTTSTCGSGAFCAVKLTQSGLQ